MLTIYILMTFMTSLCTCELKWTSYSDRADLPMSKKARDSLREQLNLVKVDYLSTQDKAKYHRIKKALEEDNSSYGHESGVGMELLIVPIVFIICGLLIAYKLRKSNVIIPDNQSTREARIKKFT